MTCEGETLLWYTVILKKKSIQMHIHNVGEDNLRMISSYLHDRVSDGIRLLPFFGQKKIALT